MNFALKCEELSPVHIARHAIATAKKNAPFEINKPSKGPLLKAPKQVPVRVGVSKNAPPSSDRACAIIKKTLETTQAKHKGCVGRITYTVQSST
jgi:hypothetical protein